MASAERQPQPGPKSNKDLIQRFRDEYADALAEAKVSAQHTETEGWQHLYLNFHKSNREQRRELAEALKGIADRLEVGEVGEAGEKEIGDLKKRVAEVREEREIFDRKTVGPVRESVEKCSKIIFDAKRQAEVDEERAPMVNIGLVEIVSAEIAKVDKPVWDSEHGRVEIRPPN